MKVHLAVQIIIFSIASTRADVAVLTQHNNLFRTGANLQETILATNNVNTNTFGLLFSRVVDDQVYAQPLVMTNVDIPGQGLRNLVLVATVNDSVYAFDADDSAVTAPYWRTSFTNANAVPPRNSDLSAIGACGGNYNDLSGKMGIMGTPVIDPVSGTIYVVARTKEFGTNFVQRLHALDLRTGQPRSNSPTVITATCAGNGAGSVGGVITFDPIRQNQRTALTLVNGVVYIAWAAHCDLQPYHGWVIGYDATNLTQAVVFNNTPNGSGGGIWMSGDGIAADPAGNLYLSVGNGSVGYNGNPRDPINRGSSFLRLTRNGGTLDVTSWFTPNDHPYLEAHDFDLGSAGILLIPGTSLAFSGGKEGVGYLVNRDNMGGLSDSIWDPNIIQRFVLTPSQLHGGMVWWDGPTASYGYVWPATVRLQQYRFDRTINKFIEPPLAQSPTTAPSGQPGGILSLSANGTNASSAILWASHQLNGSAEETTRPGILRAYDAQNVSRELWNSEQNSARDRVGNFAKFVPPTVANGKVYLATFSSKLNVYGTAAGLVSPPIIAPNGGAFTNSVTITLTNATPGAEIYYTLDGNDPTKSSSLYSTPFVLSNSAAVKAKAFKAGFVSSSVTVATFLNSSALGNGTGLTGSYYSNQFKTFNGAPNLVRTDATVNFDWVTNAPDPSISADNFTVRWTGTVQAMLGNTYTFYTTTDEGARLWINEQLIIDCWTNQPPTERSASITLAEQQRYNIRMEYYENTNTAVAALSWSAPSLGKMIIPASQLYPASNPPPVVTVLAPTNGAAYTASASLTISASATSAFNSLNTVNLYANSTLLGSVTNSPGVTSNTFALTVTGLEAGNYALTVTASDLTGVVSTSAPVNITVNSGSGLPYGLTNRAIAPAFFNMPASFDGSLPPLLSQTGVFTNTPEMSPAPALMPYAVNTPLWSDGAVKTRYFAVPNNGAPYTPAEQITFAPTGEWVFPAGTVFVKTFELATNENNPAQTRRLETRLLVRDTNAAVYGVTYKWRADNSDADLLAGSLHEDIEITTATGSRTQTWYYPSPSDCLLCHTLAANHVLGVKTRQLNGIFTYPDTLQTDNQLRSLNRLGLLNPAFDEAEIPGYAQLSALTNLNASLEERARSYLDANCASCHRPGGSGPTMDARYDTPLTNQNIINAIVSKGDMGYDNARVVAPKDLHRSVLWHRMGSTNPAIQMPSLARTVIDTNAVQVMSDWIHSLPGLPVLQPPTINPNGGTFVASVNVLLQHPDPNALLYFTLDNSLPSTNSTLYAEPLVLTSNATIKANAFATGFNNSVAATASFGIRAPVYFTNYSYFSNQQFVLPLSGLAGRSYLLQTSTNLVDWTALTTNVAPAGVFELTDPSPSNAPYRFYRAVELP